MKRIIFALLAVAVICSIAHAKYSGGSGDPGDPYQIANVSDLLTLANDANDYNKCFIMTADINLDPYLPGNKVFTKAIIAADTNDSESGFQGTAFLGTFDGNDYKISNLTISASTRDYIGLFGYVGSSGQIRNLGVENVNVTGNSYVGGLCGRNYGSINNCYSTGFVSGYSRVGGLIGVGYRIRNSFSKCTVSGQTYVGGFCGDSGGGIYRCYATGTVLGSDNAFRIGGFCGVNVGTVSNCYAKGDVSAGDDSSNIGGFCGENTSTVTIINCYSTGTVTVGASSSDIGGLCGDNTYGTVTTSYWDMDTSGLTSSNGGTGKTTTEMQTQSTFTGWDFNDVWAICETTNYPKLQWQIPAGDIICPDGVDNFDLAELCEQWLLEEIPADLAPTPTGDGIVDFTDFSVFADQWGISNGIDELFDFTGQWLKTGMPVCSADISPLPEGDGRVNADDFAALADNWLLGL